MPIRELQTFKSESTAALAVTNSFNPAVSASLSVDTDWEAAFIGNIQGIYIQVSAIVTAASVTMRITTDSAGDNVLIPDSSADLSLGLTTANQGAAVWKVDLDAATASETYYVFFKTDAGTLTVDSTTLTYRRRV